MMEYPYPGESWRHYKTDKLYVIVKIAVNSDSGMYEVIYVAQENQEEWFTLPLSVFLQHVQLGPGEFIQRFRRYRF